jgi:uncharacterized protein
LTRPIYLDSSALVKLALREPETPALRAYLTRRRGTWVSSALARTEVLRAVLPLGTTATRAAQHVLARCDLIRLNERLLGEAGILQPVELRSLDAIHLATASRLGPDLREIVTYDTRLAQAAVGLGFRVATPL